MHRGVQLVLLARVPMMLLLFVLLLMFLLVPLFLVVIIHTLGRHQGLPFLVFFAHQAILSLL